MTADPGDLDSAIKMTIMALLETVDYRLLYHFEASETTASLLNLARRWIYESGFFSQPDLLPHKEVAARLLDVVLASHPLMPLYLVVAFVTYGENRTKLLSVDAESDINDVLNELTMDTACMETKDNTDPIEEVIALAVSYMYVLAAD
jgi:hypothetical protein